MISSSIILMAGENATQISIPVFQILNKISKCYLPLITSMNVKLRLFRCNHLSLTLQHMSEMLFSSCVTSACHVACMLLGLSCCSTGLVMRQVYLEGKSLNLQELLCLPPSNIKQTQFVKFDWCLNIIFFRWGDAKCHHWHYQLLLDITKKCRHI